MFGERNEEKKDPEEGEKIKEIEEHLLQISSEMKNMAFTFGDQIKEDTKVMEKIDRKHSVNQSDLNNRTKELDAIAGYSALGFFRLLAMAITATVLFFFTLFVIFLF